MVGRLRQIPPFLHLPHVSPIPRFLSCLLHMPHVAAAARPQVITSGGLPLVRHTPRVEQAWSTTRPLALSVCGRNLKGGPLGEMEIFYDFEDLGLGDCATTLLFSSTLVFCLICQALLCMQPRAVKSLVATNRALKFVIVFHYVQYYLWR